MRIFLNEIIDRETEKDRSMLGVYLLEFSRHIRHKIFTFAVLISQKYLQTNQNVRLYMWFIYRLRWV